MNDAYLPGAAVLAHSLRDCGTTKKLACLVVQHGLRASTIEELQSLYNYVIPIEPIRNPQPANLYLMNRPDLLYTFSKINLWRQVQFRKIVYIDADVVALRAPEELFDIPDSFAAAPDVGWPDAFNSGVMVLTPDMGEYYALRGLADSGDSFDGADQGLLNQYYENRPWKRLSFTYNTTPSANYQYEPAYRYWKRNITLVHFIGKDKPWQRARDEKGAPNAFQELLSRWWAVYDRHFQVSQVAASESFSAAGYPVATTQPAPPPQHFPAQGQPYYTSHQGVEAPEQRQQHCQPPHYHSHHHTPEQSNHHAGTATPSFAERGEPAENLAQGHQQPIPTVQQRKFSAPHMEWDATRGAPPIDARPEAADFPTTTYEFNTNPAPFRPPPSYPEPPKDMYYQVPPPPPLSQSAPKPKPIFPWEEREHSRPTRRFVEDEAPPPPPELEPEAPYADELEVSTDKNIEPVTPTIKVTDNPWTSFAQQKNVWDEVNGINDYVRALTAFQKNRGKQHVLSPSNDPKPEELIEKVEQARQRRESLILTDFPTADDRPSLPVTPAPRRRSTFWGDEGRDDEADLPPAEGVPDQADWVCPKYLPVLTPSLLKY
ncbi:glycosyltransferase family 8 protein [Pseudocercospora fijiensis CIRAD86]|uniref:glycogenin glucosyltransferase n=1 Tax=Pseudocercospora fijiensis (strain CIRAD86) TaxID=383855 RepID=N1Q6P7_PSEFD|nr:glycosyltransferase family 8 protein [Pseudocercospora fijiensis CIRAD86]EME88145.1 glycosyltransferase family 8 protein [Pseudocercospora fijiensis CIRAD86]